MRLFKFLSLLNNRSKRIIKMQFVKDVWNLKKISTFKFVALSLCKYYRV